jgi:hypothetical protein
MSDLFFSVVEGISAVMAFVLAKSMVRPYRITGESRFLGLPTGFAFLGVSYVSMGASLALTGNDLIEGLKWMQLFTGAYAFVLLAVTYHLSSETRERTARLLMQVMISLMILGAAMVLITIFLPPLLEFPSYKVADEYFRLFNMILALYVTTVTLRSHVSKPEPKTIFAPLGYALLAFSQYSFLVWSVDSSFSAFLGAHIIRMAGLLVFLFVSYKAIFATPQNPPRSTVIQNEASSKG